MFVKQPGGKATEFPFSADIRSGPEDCQHVLLLDHLDEGGQVKEGRELGGAISKVKLVGARLVEVPRDIHINSVETSSLPWCGFIFGVFLGPYFQSNQTPLGPLIFNKALPCIA